MRESLGRRSSYLVLVVAVMQPWALLEAISIFIGLPSRGTPSYCFMAADKIYNSVQRKMCSTSPLIASDFLS